MALNFAVTDTRFNHSNFSPGRPYGDVDGIVIHHWGVDNQSHQGVVAYLTNPDNHGASAHYVVSAGRVTQLVHDYDRAWHAGAANGTKIGIECRPEKSLADFQTVAKTIAAIWDQHGRLPLTGHCDHMPTACPHRWYAELAALAAAADQILAERRDGTHKARVNEKRSGYHEAVSRWTPLAVDGIWGPATSHALQMINNSIMDGVISSQSEVWRSYMPAAGAGWEFVPADAAEGSLLVRRLQQAWGVAPDGLFGPDTIRAMQRYYRVPVTGRLDEATVKALQTAINRQMAKHA